MVKEWRWIIYRWAAHEDLIGFTGKILSGEMQTSEDICAKLKEQYCLVVDENYLKEILDDLIGMEKAEKGGGRYRKDLTLILGQDIKNLTFG